ncbi:hypothetical protein HGRIS_008382 [Hohenbuehelia grisea]|uniref:N-acetyltransferase domain-containing protein n=1 Tax=Hohenbuehelia grisea TaxID=104357 RepID=A0ABR3J886_9AGAR
MAKYQLYPLEFNTGSNEPFLRLSPPHENIIITPPRASDVSDMVTILNDPLVQPWMGMPMESFERANIEAWVVRLKAESDKLVDELMKAEEGDELKVIDGCPIRSLREVQPDGSELYLGDLGVRRCTWTEVLEEREKQRLVDENAARAAGDPGIVWQVADFLVPSHHRRGIMSMALANLLQKWAIPRMGVKHIRLAIFDGNEGSLGVFGKAGFVEVDKMIDGLAVRGEKRTLRVLEWRLERLLDQHVKSE